MLPTSEERGRAFERGLQLARLEGFYYEGVRVKLVRYDNEMDQATTRTQVRSAFEEDDCLALIGPLDTHSLRAAAQAAAEVAPNATVLAPRATYTDLTLEHTNVLRLAYNDETLAEAGAQGLIWLLEQRGEAEPSVAVVYDADQLDAMDRAFAFSHRLEELGGEVVLEEAIDSQADSVEELIQRVAARGVQAVYLPGTAAFAATLLAEAGEAWEGRVVMGSEAWEAARLFEQAGETLEKLEAYTAAHFLASDERAARFVEHYEHHFEQPPNETAALGFDTGMLLIEAVVRASERAGGVPSREALTEALRSPGHVHGALETFRIDAISRGSDRHPVFARLHPHGMSAARALSEAASRDAAEEVIVGDIVQLRERADGGIIAVVHFPEGADLAESDHWHVHDSQGHVLAHIAFVEALPETATATEAYEGRIEPSEGVRDVREGDRVSNQGTLDPIADD